MIMIGREHAAKHAQEFVQKLDRFRKARNLTMADTLYVVALALSSLPPELCEAYDKLYGHLREEIAEVRKVLAAREAAEATKQ
ncbi:hypothetical protein PQJ75_00840 [Rhodoplanes sp. TEM]|uniref:Uncharacterized protein n=1 Tax=Rhodoplanes tepidamans TaxID=200616 RepID=A0ABT5J581_RHOTP|nr:MULTISPECIES: hypothetical protein [Rhodoplanes]MDC7784799.1 hypothetical protein [Rhodoplanes tepidamans]MDC7982266.1 hypothetical protein [Rhodoplanes sp. TEM]MDQ0356273.1 hypothetical protein [Rhodoplanes tepidamans]